MTTDKQTATIRINGEDIEYTPTSAEIQTHVTTDRCSCGDHTQSEDLQTLDRIFGGHTR